MPSSACTIKNMRPGPKFKATILQPKHLACASHCLHRSKKMPKSVLLVTVVTARNNLTAAASTRLEGLDEPQRLLDRPTDRQIVDRLLTQTPICTSVMV